MNTQLIADDCVNVFGLAYRYGEAIEYILIAHCKCNKTIRWTAYANELKRLNLKATPSAFNALSKALSMAQCHETNRKFDGYR
jgi:hypothetical protein